MTYLSLRLHLFASKIAAILIADGDLQICGFNVGLSRVVDRFHALFIDKERANFKGEI